MQCDLPIHTALSTVVSFPWYLNVPPLSTKSQILKPPASYKPIHTPARKLTATPTPMGMSGFRFQMEDDKIKIVDDLQPVGAGKQELPYMKMEDTQYFAKLLEDVDEETLPADEQKERKIMRLLLKIKNGTPPMRKVRSLTSY